MNIQRSQVGKIAILDKAINELNGLVSNNEITKAEALGVLRKLNKDLQSISGEIVDVKKIEKDSMVYMEQLEDIVSSVNYNYTYYAAEIDLLNSVAKVVTAYVDGEIEKANEALAETADILGVMKVYTASKSKNPHAISITKNEIINSDFSTYGSSISAKLTSEKKTQISSISVVTNGMIGNLLELEQSIPVLNPLEDDEVKFIDERNIFNNKARLKDSSLNTVFEVEAYKVKDDVQQELLLLDIKKRVISDTTRAAEFVTINWNKAPENNTLTATINIETSSPFNVLKIEPNLINTYQKVRNILVSSTGESWTSIAEDVFLVPDINKFDEKYSHQKGIGVFYTPASGLRFAKIFLEQDTGYDSKIAHCFYHEQGSTVPVNGEFWSITNEDKTDFFKSDTIIVDGTELGKDAMAIPAKRWSISLVNIGAAQNKYERESLIETKTFDIKGKIIKVALSCNEIIPAGCSIDYELSHDNGFTWTKINPIERSDGAEIISFSNNDMTSDVQSVKYVTVDNLPSSLKLRVTINTDRNNTPTISNLTINPVVSLED